MKMRKNRSTRWVVSVFGDARRSGPWHGCDRIRAVAVFGDTTLDMGGAGGATPEMVVATAVFGDVNVRAPEDCAVELTGVALLGDNRSEVGARSVSPGRSLRVKGLAVFGDVKVS